MKKSGIDWVYSTCSFYISLLDIRHSLYYYYYYYYYYKPADYITKYKTDIVIGR